MTLQTTDQRDSQEILRQERQEIHFSLLEGYVMRMRRLTRIAGNRNTHNYGATDFSAEINVARQLTKVALDELGFSDVSMELIDESIARSVHLEAVDGNIERENAIKNAGPIRKLFLSMGDE